MDRWVAKPFDHGTLMITSSLMKGVSCFVSVSTQYDSSLNDLQGHSLHASENERRVQQFHTAPIRSISFRYRAISISNVTRWKN